MESFNQPCKGFTKGLFNQNFKDIIKELMNFKVFPQKYKEITYIFNRNEKQVRKILIILNEIRPFDLDAYTLQYMTRICVSIGFTQKFLTLCRFFYSSLKNHNLGQGGHEHAVASALFKLARDLMFHKKGGINVNMISLTAGCCEISLKNLLQKIQTYNQLLLQQAYEYYRRTIRIIK